MKVISDTVNLDDIHIKILKLCSNNEKYSNEFASIALDFIKLGENNSNRMSLLANPYDWIEKMERTGW